MLVTDLSISAKDAAQVTRSFEEIKTAAGGLGQALDRLAGAFHRLANTQAQIGGPPMSPSGSGGASLDPALLREREVLANGLQKVAATIDTSERALARRQDELVRFFENVVRTILPGLVAETLVGELPVPGQPERFHRLDTALVKLGEQAVGADPRQQAAIASKLEDLITDIVVRQKIAIAPLQEKEINTIAANKERLQEKLREKSSLKDGTTKAKQIDKDIKELVEENLAAKNAVLEEWAKFEELITEARSLFDQLSLGADITGSFLPTGPKVLPEPTGRSATIDIRDTIKGLYDDLPPIPLRRPEVIRGEKELLKAVEDTTQALGDQRAAFEALAGPEGRGALHQLALSGEVFSDLPPLLTEVGEAAEKAQPAVAGLLPAPDLLDQAAAGLESFAGTAEQRFSETADRLQDGLGETILDIFNGASPKQALRRFTQFAKASFSGLLQDLAQAGEEILAALRNPIVTRSRAVQVCLQPA